jgi:hypothetical protein
MAFKLLFAVASHTIKSLFRQRKNWRADAVLKELQPTSLHNVAIRPRRYEETVGGRGRLH